MLFTLWKNNGDGAEERREHWEISSIENGVMNWTALRRKADGTTYTATYTMTKVDEPVDDGYVDLGLPSGTRWNSVNETGGDRGFYTFEEAVSAFGDKLPTKEQLEELKTSCTWEWQENVGYKVTGTNGNFIILPAEGYRYVNGEVYDTYEKGFYWSSTPASSEYNYAWCFYFHAGAVNVYDYNRVMGYSIRLVK
jgi:uncharacterized protein (TIGR02145 family)